MKRLIGVWIDHKKAVLVSAPGDGVPKTVHSDVDPHSRWHGALVGGGEKAYEARHAAQIGRFLDAVIAQIETADLLYLFGPGEAKFELQKRLAGVKGFARVPVHVEAADKLTDAQIVAKVRARAGDAVHGI